MEYDDEIIADFLGEYSDAQIETESIFSVWDKSSSYSNSIDSLFRVIHSLKGNFRMMYLPQLSENMHVVEDLLAQLRENKRPLIPGFTILISTILEQCKEFSKQIFAGDDKNEDIKTLSYVLIDLTQASNDEYASALRYALLIIDQIGAFGNDYHCEPLFDFLEQEELKNSVNPTPYIHHEPVKDQLDFFKGLITQVESFFPLWRNRSQRILTLVSHMNSLRRHTVDPIQLEAAVYLHDLGMSFIPPQTLYGSNGLTNDDRQLMQSHCETGFQLLSYMSGWEEAARMVYQHHERVDGTGYPLGLSSEQICDGAKLLAIGDAYASITSPEKKDSNKTSLMFAIMEIEKGSNSQFDPAWVKVFAEVGDILDI